MIFGKKKKNKLGSVKKSSFLLGYIHGVPFRKNSLTFLDKSFESLYVEHNFYQIASHLRSALLLGFLIFFSFGVIDYFLLPDTYLFAWSIRILAFGPLAIFLVALSYTKSWRVMQPASAFLMLIAGVVNVVLTYQEPPLLGSVYYVGVLLFLLYGYTVLRVRFAWMARAGLLMILFYEVFVWQVAEISTVDFLINNIFLIGANVMGMMASYTIDYFSRRDFVQSVLFMNSADKLALSLGEHQRHVKSFIKNSDEVVLFQLRYDNSNKTVVKVESVSKNIFSKLGLSSKESEDLFKWFGSEKILLKEIKQVLQAGKSYQKDLQKTVKNQTKWFRFSVLSSFQDRGGVCYALGMIIDITKEKQYQEKQAQLLLEKTYFLNTLAHQLNTPLNVIRWGSESLVSLLAGADKKVTNIITNIEQASARAVGVIRDIMASFALWDDDYQVQLASFVSLKDFVDDVLVVFKSKMKQRSFVLVFDKKYYDFKLKGDQEKLHLILEKVLSNAFDYSTQGQKVSLEVFVKSGFAHFLVFNEGITIDTNTQANLFKLFKRSKEAVKVQPNRTGLGLSLAKFYSQKHGGDVELLSSDSSGTLFLVKLPVF